MGTGKEKKPEVKILGDNIFNPPPQKKNKQNKNKQKKNKKKNPEFRLKPEVSHLCVDYTVGRLAKTP